MKAGLLLSITFLLIHLACQKSNNDSVISNNRQQKEVVAVQKETLQAKNDGEEKVWRPPEIEECISKVNVGEPFEMATFINPFYLRANLDGNNLVDYAVLIQGQQTKKHGLVICKDSKEPFIFGAVSKHKEPLSSFEDDDFITKNWGIETKEMTRSLDEYAGGHKIATDAKGESVAFYFDGGSVFIYWDGRTFQVVEGG